MMDETDRTKESRKWLYRFFLTVKIDSGS
jgi:hypothetical protein